MSSRLNEREAEELLLHGDPVELGRRADAERRKRFDDTVTFIVDRNINYWIDFDWDNENISFAEILEAVGELPIPPYLNRETQESDKTTAKEAALPSAPASPLRIVAERVSE